MLSRMELRAPICRKSHTNNFPQWNSDDLLIHDWHSIFGKTVNHHLTAICSIEKQLALWILSFLFFPFLPLSFTVFLYFLLPPGRFSTCDSMTDRAHMNTSWSDFPYSPPPTDCNIYVESVRLQPVCAYVTIGYPHTQIELQGIKVIKYSLNRASHTPKYSRVI